MAKRRLKRIFGPLLVGLTLIIGLVGPGEINSNHQLSERGVTMMAASPPTKTIKVDASAYSDFMSRSAAGQAINSAAQAGINGWAKVKHFIAHQDELLPAHSYSLYELWYRTLNDGSKAQDYGDYVGALSTSGAIRSYDNADVLSQIIALLGQLVAGVAALLAMVVLALAYLVQMIGQVVIKLVGYLNVFQYIGQAFEGSLNRNDPWARGLAPLIDIYTQFKPIIMTLAAVLLAVVVTKTIMGSRGSRGRTFGTGVLRYFGVFFAWGVMPLILGGMISFTTDIVTQNDLTQNTRNVVQSTYYNARAPFAAAFYHISDAGGMATSADLGGIDESTVHASWQHNTDLGLPSMNEFSILSSWMRGERFDAEDVNGYLGWTSNDKDGADSNLGFFSRKAKKGGGTEGDGGESWAASHVYLNQLMDADGGPVDGKPAIAEGTLESAGFGDSKSDAKKADLFLQTNSTSDAKEKAGSDRLRRLVTTHAIAAWGVSPSGNVNVSRDTGMNTKTNRAWAATTLVGDTIIAKTANYSSMMARLIFTVVYAIIAYVGIVTILANTIGRALLDQMRAGTGSIGAIARAFAGVLLAILMIWYVALSVGMVAPLMEAVDALMRTAITQVLGGGVVGSIASQLVSIFAINVGGYLVIRMLMALRGSLLNGGTNAVNQLAESIDRALGIQPGSDSSVSAGMKRGAEGARRSSLAGFKAMDKSKQATLNAPAKATGAGLRMAGGAAENLAPIAGIAATAAVGPAAGKAAELGLKGAGKAAKGLGKATEILGAGDETMDKAGMGATLAAMKNNFTGENGSVGDKAKSALQTLRGEKRDSGDVHADADPSSPEADLKNDFNKAVDAKETRASVKDARRTLRREGRGLKAIAKKTEALANGQAELRESTEQLGAAKFAEAVSDGKLSNAEALAKATGDANSAVKAQRTAQTSRQKAAVAVDQAQEKLVEMKKGAADLKERLVGDVNAGKIDSKGAMAQLKQAKQDIRAQSQVVQQARSAHDTAVATEQEAVQRVHETAGAQKMVQETVGGQDPKKPFIPQARSGMASTQVLQQKVQDAQKVVNNLERKVVQNIEQHATRTGRTNISSSSNTVSDVVSNSRSYLDQAGQSVQGKSIDANNAAQANEVAKKRHLASRLKRQYGNKTNENGGLID